MSSPVAVRWASALCVALLLACTLARPALAEDANEIQYRRRPSADLALALGRKALAAGQLARAMNWLERAVRSPGATSQHQAALSRTHKELRWQLVDEGYGTAQITVRPAHAVVRVDGMELLPHVATHVVWLQQGSHTVEADAPPDYGSVNSAVSVRRGERQSVDLSCALVRPPVLLAIIKPEAEVWIDNAFVGMSGKGRFGVAPGSHMVELRAEGCMSWAHSLTFAVGEDKRLELALAREPSDGFNRRQASQVDRQLLPSELSERGDDRDLGVRPEVDSPLEKGWKSRPDVVRGGGPQAQGDDKRLANTKTGGDTRNTMDSVRAAPPQATVSSSAGADPVSEGPVARTTKGWLWMGLGLASAGAGVGMAVLGTQAAELANEDRNTLRKPDAYAAAWNAATQQTYIGYGAAAVGGASMLAGSYYLFGDGGLSRKGKGWLLTGLGVAAGGVAGWLIWDAREMASHANTFKRPDPDYDRQFDTAQREATIGYAAAGLGGALTATGLYLALTGSGSSRVASSDAPSQRVATLPRWQFAPWLSGHASGGTLALGW